MDHGTDQVNRIDGYAAALLDIASVEAVPSERIDEFCTAATALGGNGELIEVLRDPRIPSERKQAIIDDLLGTRAAPVTVAAMNFLVSAGQARHLADIAAKLAEKAADAEGEVVAEVRTAMDLDEDQVDRLRGAIARATNKRVQLRVIVDPSVVGGVVTKVGDTVLDGSIRGRFAELREQWG